LINTNLQDIVNHLKNDLLIEPEALVWLHSGVIGMGVLNGGIVTITNAFEKVLSRGALVIPTFTYSWCNGESFDPKRSECPDVGAYAEKAWKDDRYFRNNNPNFSVAAMDNTVDGVVKNEICDVTANSTCFGKGSVFEKMWQISLDRPGYILLLGGAHNDVVFRTTFLHMVEEKIDVPYRYNKHFFNPEDKNDKVAQYVRYLSKEEYQSQNNKLPPPNLEFPIISKYNKLGQDVENDGLLEKKKFAYSQSRLVPINRFCTWLMSKLEKEPNYLLS
tara:strand:- start:3 stop:827 length:825 start_codon:yes stop_codon:yes gene_type:complete